MGKNDLVRVDYGWSVEACDMFFTLNPDIPKGSFQVLTKSGKDYWYYYYSKGKNRSEYLCACKDQNSFTNACLVLVQKTKNGESYTKKSKALLSRYKDKYHDVLKEELTRGQNRSKSTIEKLIRNSTYFLDYCDKHKVRLYTIQTKEFKNTLIDYIKELQTKGLKRASIRVYLQDARYYLQYICSQGKYSNKGLDIFDSHIYTQDLQNTLINDYVGRRENKEIVPFKTEYYTKIYDDCLKSVRKIWGYYCKHGTLKRIGYEQKTNKHITNPDRNYHINQPEMFIGSEDLVMMLSLVQLLSGVRIGEIFYSYTDRDTFDKVHNKNELGSFIEETEYGWAIYIHNSKRKDRIVPVDYTIRNWKNKPPIDDKLFKTIKVDGTKQIYYDTPLLVVIRELFKQKRPHHYLIPQVNRPKEKKDMDINDAPRSKNYYMNEFKRVSKSYDWDKYYIKTTHNLRSLYISFMISVGKDAVSLSQITGHKVSTMMQYYLRTDIKKKFDLAVPQKDLHDSTKWINS